MKRLTPLAEEERMEHGNKLNLVDMATHGWWECRRCNQAVRVEDRVDHDDDSLAYHVCLECGSHHVVWRPPVLRD